MATLLTVRLHATSFPPVRLLLKSSTSCGLAAAWAGRHLALKAILSPAHVHEAVGKVTFLERSRGQPT